MAREFYCLLSQYNKKSLACEYWVSGQRYSDAISLDLFSLEVITGPSVTPDMVEEGQSASLGLVASIFPAPGPETEVIWTVEDSAARELVRLGPGDKSSDGQYKAGDIMVRPSITRSNVTMLPCCRLLIRWKTRTS